MTLSKYFQQVCLHRYRKFGHTQIGDRYVPIYRCTICKKESETKQPPRAAPKLEPNK